MASSSALSRFSSFSLSSSLSFSAKQHVSEHQIFLSALPTFLASLPHLRTHSLCTLNHTSLFLWLLPTSLLPLSLRVCTFSQFKFFFSSVINTLSLPSFALLLFHQMCSLEAKPLAAPYFSVHYSSRVVLLCINTTSSHTPLLCAYSIFTYSFSLCTPRAHILFSSVHTAF